MISANSGTIGAGCFTMLLLALAGCSGGNGEARPGEETVGEQEATISNRMIEAIKDTSLRRDPEGRVRRFNQAKSHGCFDARFTVAGDLADDLRHGVFARSATYSARVRFASASEDDDTKKDFRGMSIKLSGVPGQPLWGKPGEQDFLLNSYPALFAADPEEFLAFIEAVRDDAKWKFFLNPLHFGALLRVLKGRSEIDSLLDIDYFSTTPYRHGPSQATAVKYSARPCTHTKPAMGDERHKDFLAETMKRQLQEGPACFDFMVQFQVDAEAMPVEDASVVWDQELSPFHRVATLIIEDQDFRSPEAMAACERMSFNPWQSLPAHQPLGGINRVRKSVYAEIAKFRQEQNRIRERRQAGGSDRQGR